MIVYFANRHLEVIGQASTSLPKGLSIRDDNRIEDIETGVATFEGRIPYDKATRSLAEACVTGGNYVFRYDEHRNGELFCITEYEHDNKDRECYFYAEDAGLSLLNEIAIKWPDNFKGTAAAPAMTLTQYFNMWIAATGFEIGINDAASDATKKAPETLSSADSEQTVIERLRSIATDFGYEVSYSYALNTSFTNIEKMLVNIYKKRGQDNGIRLAVNREVDKIVVKGNLDKLATSLLVYGGDVNGKPLTLQGYNYSSPNNDYMVGAQYFASRKKTGYCLQSPSALAKWGRLVNGQSRHITRVFSNEATRQSDLAAAAAKELDKCTNVEVNYEIDISRLPPGTQIGDYVYVTDEEGELYLKARILKLEESVSNSEAKATLGEYLIQSGGISETVRNLAVQFEQMAAKRQFYTWIAYADDDQGTGISLLPLNKKYIGIAVNQITDTVDITDPSVFSWVEIVSEKVINLQVKITSSAGQVFITTKVDTTLTAHVYLNGEELDSTAISDIGVIRWYKDGIQTQVTGQTYTITAADDIDATNMTAQLEVDT